KKRFININQTEISLVKFLTSPPPATREEFSKLLESGTILYERNMMNTTALTQVLLTKSPDALKPLLFTAAEQANDWQSFIQRAEQVAFIAYPDKMLNRIEARGYNKAQNYINDSKKVIRSNNSFQNRNQNNNFNRNIANKGNIRNRQVANNYNNNSSFICEIHGRGTHTSEECWTLKNMISRGWSRPTRINCVENESISDIENEGEDMLDNKNNFVYSLNFTVQKNPFFIVAKFFGVERNCLIDTGADISLIHEEMIPKKINRSKHSGIVKSACGTQLPITKQLKNAEIYVLGKKIKFSPLITTGEPNYIILGVDVIKNSPGIIMDILSSRINTINAIEAEKTKHTLSEANEEEILENFKEMFSEEIDHSRICKMVKHKIDTEEAKPIHNKTRRIPVHFTREIGEEIDKNLKLGIIRPSRSPWCSGIVPILKPDGSLRMCIDYRPLNNVTVKDRYPLPRIDEIMDAVAGAR
ncbi:Retrovirus-related Pol polyprotein from transposon opus, partial [Nosema granulosis]